MARESPQPAAGTVWRLARQQHGVVARRQLLELGFTRMAIEHRLRNGRLHSVVRGVYAVGRPEVSRRGWWMAAVLRCGAGAALSHESAGAAWGIRSTRDGPIEISVPAGSCHRPPGIRVHRRSHLAEEHLARVDRIPVTSPILTLVDLASRLTPSELETAINEADKRDVVTPEALRAGLNAFGGYRGVPRLRRVLDRHTFVLTDSELERRFLPMALQAGLPLPLTGQWLNGFRVDFYWPHLGLVVETDGFRYHRTPAAQTRDRRRDQAHAAAGLTPLRFTHAQVRFEPDQVEATLAAVASRLARPKSAA